MSSLKERLDSRKQYWLENEKGSFVNWFNYIFQLDRMPFSEFIKIFGKIFSKLYVVVIFFGAVIAAMTWPLQENVQLHNWVILIYLIPGYIYSIVLLIAVFIFAWVIWIFLPVEKISIREFFREAWSAIGLWTAAGFVVGIVATVIQVVGRDGTVDFSVWEAVLYTSALFGFVGVPLACIKLVSLLSQKFYFQPLALLIIPFLIWGVHIFLGYISNYSLTPEGIFTENKEYYIKQIVEYAEGVTGELATAEEVDHLDKMISDGVNYSFLVPAIQILVFFDMLKIVIKSEIPKWKISR